MVQKTLIFIIFMLFVGGGVALASNPTSASPTGAKLIDRSNINLENLVDSAFRPMTIEEPETPCSYCSTCHGLILCVHCECGDCEKSIQDLLDDLCRISEDCCYTISDQ